MDKYRIVQVYECEYVIQKKEFWGWGEDCGFFVTEGAAQRYIDECNSRDSFKRAVIKEI